MKNFTDLISIVLATATLAVVLTYALGAKSILQSPYAEPGHDLFMSLKGRIAGQDPDMHETEGPASEAQNYGIIGNNVLGGPASLSAGGLAAVVVYTVIPLAVAAFAISWKQWSFIVGGLLTASGIILMILPLQNMNLVFPGPIIGVIVGLVIFGLGMTIGIRKARTVTIPSK